MKKILVAPLNWGLGHAARCVPVIQGLVEAGFSPVLASDGEALLLLQKEFPDFPHYELPSYGISYAKKGSFLSIKLLAQWPGIRKSARREWEVVQEIIQKEGIGGIISDNRFGVFSKEIPSIYITHQLKVYSGIFTPISSAIHQKIIKKFTVCWVPDYEGPVNLSGKLAHPKPKGINIEYIHPISRFNPQEFIKVFDLLVLLSGPEPQRSIVEKKLAKELKDFDGKVILVRGKMSQNQSKEKIGNLEIVNFMLKDELEETISRSNLVLSRSGYSTIMDLEKLKAKAFFIPTPGQLEQIYLAKHLENLGIAGYCHQDQFDLEKLNSALQYRGFEHKKTPNKNLSQFPFGVFQT